MPTATQTVRMTAYEFLAEKPLPSLPSPTLTNPDMVLPMDFELPAFPSPPRDRHGFLGASHGGDARDQDAAAAARNATPKKEKRGLMSRKLMLLRSRTSSALSLRDNAALQQAPSGVQSLSDTASVESTSATPIIPSAIPEEPSPVNTLPPTLMDVGNLAPKRPDSKRVSTDASSFNSDELAGIPSFLAKYGSEDGTVTEDDLFDPDTPGSRKYGYSCTIEGGSDGRRKQQEEDEQNSALLSKRAEQILANAKRRLNLMEGNLRGARDLVAPLTAANLKRASSVGSSSRPSLTSGGGRFVSGGYRYEPHSPLLPIRTLHAQASSPTMGREYLGHTRVASETEFPGRPRTAPPRRNSSLMRKDRIPVKTSDGSWTSGLRSRSSLDSVGSSNGVLRTSPRGEQFLLAKGSPDLALGSLPEDDGSQNRASEHHGIAESGECDALGIENTQARTDDLRVQMSSLKGKISSLTERAREDSLKRQSGSFLRTPSPFNNAAGGSPEVFYTPSPVQSGGDEYSGASKKTQSNGLAVSETLPFSWERARAPTGNRNAFAEQVAVKGLQGGRISPEWWTRDSLQRRSASDPPSSGLSIHKRTPSGSAYIEPAVSRFSHYQYVARSQPSGSFNQQIPPKVSPSDASEESGVSPLLSDEQSDTNRHSVVSEDVDSVYEDAEYEQPPAVAHEDRHDAFDYQNFFLHSAVGGYNTSRRASTSSKNSASSAGTARGPSTFLEDDFNPSSGLYPPPTPETPERLREIERILQHQRTTSSDSVSTTASFATAHEGQTSPRGSVKRISVLDWPIPPSNAHSRSNSRSTSRPTSRANSAVKRAARDRDVNFDRADSGLGLSPRRSLSSKQPGTQAANAPTAGVASPLLSPQIVASHDPVAVAVNALLDPLGRPLGLKDKALLFSLVEGLRKGCRKLQAADEGQYESRVLRRRLDDARRALEGTLEL